MSNSKEPAQNSALVESSTNRPQIVSNFGLTQDGYQPGVALQGIHSQDHPTTVSSIPPAPEIYKIQLDQTLPHRDWSYHQGYPLAVNTQESNPQEANSQAILPPGVYVQGDPPQVNFTPTLPIFKTPGLDDSTVYTPDQNAAEDGDFKKFDFTEKTIRAAFIKKVYGILTCQLLITIAVIALFMFCEPIKRLAYRNTFMLVTAFIIYIAVALILICFTELRRKAPTNMIFLGIFTLATSYLLGVVTSTYRAESVMLAVGITAVVVLALTLFAFQTKYDFTVMGGGLFCALVVLILFGFMCALMPSKVMNLLYASAGALIFSLYLIYDTQLMLGGKHKYTISPEEYIFAALSLYLDVINLFLKILSLVGRR